MREGERERSCRVGRMALLAIVRAFGSASRSSATTSTTLSLARSAR